MKGLSFSEAIMTSWLEGRKSVTRRLMKPQPFGVYVGVPFVDGSGPLGKTIKPPYLPGETVYIKETWRAYAGEDDSEYEHPSVEYKADSPGKYQDLKWKSPRFMPEWASRSHALIISVRPERVQEITDDEAFDEGIVDIRFAGEERVAFHCLWESLYPGSWERNDWCWRVELEKLSRQGGNNGKAN